MLQSKVGAARQAAAEVMAMERNSGEVGASWKDMEGVLGNEQFLRGMWEYFTLEKTEQEQILADGAQEKQEGQQGHRQQESPFKKRSADEDCGPQMMRRGHLAMKNGSWEDFKGVCVCCAQLCLSVLSCGAHLFQRTGRTDLSRSAASRAARPFP